MNILFRSIPLVAALLFFSLACDQRNVDLTNLKYFGFGNKLGCKAVSANHHYVDHETSLWGAGRLKEVLKSKIEKGTDKLGIQVIGSKLEFLTAAAVGSGSTKPALFEILRNDENALIATYYQKESLDAADLFLLNKETGFAIWFKGKPADPFSSSYPSSSTYFLFCQ